MKKLFCFSALFLFCFVVNARKISVLCIGNSFSEDAVENYLYDIALAADDTLTIGNLYIGGCSLEEHLQNAENDATTYSYRKIVNGVKTTTENTQLSQAIPDEAWDFISFQQVSQNTGQLGTFAPLYDLYIYVNALKTNKNVQYLWHITWAYAQNSTHSGFANYHNNQITMFNSIITATQMLAAFANNYGVSLRFVPTGTAIQNGRTSTLGDNFCRDGYHLNTTFGRYTAACVWFEILTGKSVLNNAFLPANISETVVNIAQQAAHTAVIAPTKITDLNNF